MSSIDQMGVYSVDQVAINLITSYPMKGFTTNTNIPTGFASQAIKV